MRKQIAHSQITIVFVFAPELKNLQTGLSGLIQKIRLEYPIENQIILTHLIHKPVQL